MKNTHFQTEKYQENKRNKDFQIIDPMNCRYDSKNRGKIGKKRNRKRVKVSLRGRQLPR